jgi:hypothetical protein
VSTCPAGVGDQERVSVRKCAGFRRLVGSADPECAQVFEGARVPEVDGAWSQGEDVCPSADHPRP